MLSATSIANEKGVLLPGATVPEQVTLDAFTIVHVHVVLMQVPGTADNSGGKVTVLTAVPVTWPMLLKLKFRVAGWPYKRLHGPAVGVAFAVLVGVGVRVRVGVGVKLPPHPQERAHSLAATIVQVASQSLKQQSPKVASQTQFSQDETLQPAPACAVQQSLPGGIVRVGVGVGDPPPPVQMRNPHDWSSPSSPAIVSAMRKRQVPPGFWPLN